jgi:hypothetical protein
MMTRFLLFHQTQDTTQRERDRERDRERGREGDAIEETDLKNGATETTEVRWCRWLEEPAGGGGEVSFWPL